MAVASGGQAALLCCCKAQVGGRQPPPSADGTGSSPLMWVLSLVHGQQPSLGGQVGITIMAPRDEGASIPVSSVIALVGKH